jgi:uncharacterized membrane protein HdeD (DUF308 family)
MGVGLWTLVILVPGILLILLGGAAIILPLLAPLSIAKLLAWIFLISGITRIIHAILSHQAGVFGVKLLESILDLLLGILLATNILVGTLSLTLLVGITIFISGVLAVVRAFSLRPASNWGWLLFSGIIRIILGIIIWSKWPSNAEWLIGLFVGLAFLATGLSLIKLGLTLSSDLK